ncbi:MAG: hypothetical protein PHN74_03025 [Candidatus Pacebacteria bacterium]|nr:hypothetical protein [Candidatus Paceibacterota bacterium]
MSIISFILFVVIISVIFALMEIQIEGPHGWAQDLPTWKKYYEGRGPLKALFNEKRPLTGYHLYLNLLLFLLMHFGFLTCGWFLSGEYYLISAFMFILVLEDFLWFILNPAYGISKFDPQHIKWIGQWYLNIPLQYYFSIPVAVLFYLLAGFVR